MTGVDTLARQPMSQQARQQANCTLCAAFGSGCSSNTVGNCHVMCHDDSCQSPSVHCIDSNNQAARKCNPLSAGICIAIGIARTSSVAVDVYITELAAAGIL